METFYWIGLRTRSLITLQSTDRKKKSRFLMTLTISLSDKNVYLLFQIAFMSVFVAPLRLFLTSFFFGMTYVAALAALIEMDVVKSPLKGLRRLLYLIYLRQRFRQKLCRGLCYKTCLYSCLKIARKLLKSVSKS